MRATASLFLLLGLLASGPFALSQRYGHLLHQQLTEADLRYMPANELNVLKNEIIALGSAETKVLSDRDRANLALIAAMKIENASSECSDSDLLAVFHQLAEQGHSMPIHLAEKFYGVALNPEMDPYQKVIPLSEDLLGFWVPYFPSDCDICPYQNHFSIVNRHTGERTATLETEGLLHLREDNVIEINALHLLANDAATQPAYYQILDNGQLISVEQQVVRLEPRD